MIITPIRKIRLRIFMLGTAATVGLVPISFGQLPNFLGKAGGSSDLQATFLGNSEAMRSGLESLVRAGSQSKSEGPNSPLIDAQTARGMEYDNQIKGVNTYFQKRKLNRMYRDAESGQRTGTENARSTSSNAPDRLTAAQFDRYSGELHWPAALRTDFYGKARYMLGNSFTAHVQAGGGIDSDHYAEVVRLTDAIKTKLREQIKTIQPQQYSSARSFIESVQYEARFVTGA
jgi:hypothetical protein